MPDLLASLLTQSKRHSTNSFLSRIYIFRGLSEYRSKLFRPGKHVGCSSIIISNDFDETAFFLLDTTEQISPPLYHVARRGPHICP